MQYNLMKKIVMQYNLLKKIVMQYNLMKNCNVVQSYEKIVM